MDKVKDVMSKAVNKADDVFNSLKKAYADRVVAKDLGATKYVSVASPDDRTGISVSSYRPKVGKNEYSTSAYSRLTEKMPDKSYLNLSTPLGDVSAKMDDGIFRGEYTSPWEKYDYGTEEPYGHYRLGDLGKSSYTKGQDMDYGDDFYADLSRYTNGDGMNDYTALIQSGLVNLPTIEKSINTPLGSLSFGTQGQQYESEPWSTVYGEFIPSRKTQDAYEILKNAIAKRMYLNSKGTQL